MLASHSLIVILSLSGGGWVTGNNWSKVRKESDIFLDNVGDLNDRGRESRLISIIRSICRSAPSQVKIV